MKNILRSIAIAAIVLFSAFIHNANAQNKMGSSGALDAKQAAIVTVSAFTATGQQAPLKASLNQALDAGASISELKEILVQLYAYTGFPRSLNALQTFMDVLKERKGQGINDATGKDPSPLPANKSKLQFGTEMQTKLIGRTVSGAVYAFAPAIDRFLKEHLFGDIFGRDNLDWKARELATISALAALGGVEAQLRSHIGVSLYNGLTEAQLNNWVSIIQTKVGSKEGAAARGLLQSVLQQRQGNSKANETVADKAAESAKEKKGMMIRISEIEIHRDSLDRYKTILKEEAEASVRLEPGVISIFPMYQQRDSTQVRILEIYASREAYESHLKTPHFLRYKTATLAMVKSLQLVDMHAIDAATMPVVFRKVRE